MGLFFGGSTSSKGKPLTHHDFDRVVGRLNFRSRSYEKREYVKSVFDDAFDGYGSDKRYMYWNEFEEIFEELQGNRRDSLLDQDLEEIMQEFKREFKITD